MKHQRNESRAVLLLGLLVFSVYAATASGLSEETVQADVPGSYRIGVFVPGVVDGSPTYEMLVDGVERAVAERSGSQATVIEGGFDQSTWGETVMAMAASGAYDLIVTSNPSMPEIAANVAAAVPDVTFLVLDGFLEGNDRIHTVLFNQREQAYLSGYFAGLATVPGNGLTASNAELRVGLLAGQEYPMMNEVILPAYEEGLRAAAGSGTVDFRVLGNWFDAGRAQEIVTDMISQGSDAILTIAGGGNQGAIAAAREQGAYILWYDDSGYDQAPGLVIGSSFVRQDQAAYQGTLAAIDGELALGQARILGVADGAVSFDTDHPSFIAAVPTPIVEEMESVLGAIADGSVSLPMSAQ